MLLIFPIILELCILSMGISLLLSSLYVKFRDISHIWEVLMQGAFYATPIFWPITMILERSAIAGKFLLMNPMAQIIQDSRWSIVTHTTPTIYSTINNPFLWFAPFILIVIVFILGMYHFKKKSNYFAEIM